MSIDAKLFDVFYMMYWTANEFDWWVRA